MKRCALLICIVVAPLFAAEHSSVATINSRIQTVSTCCPKGIFLDTHLYIADDQPFYISLIRTKLPMWVRYQDFLSRPTLIRYQPISGWLQRESYCVFIKMIPEKYHLG